MTACEQGDTLPLLQELHRPCVGTVNHTLWNHVDIDDVRRLVHHLLPISLPIAWEFLSVLAALSPPRQGGDALSKREH